MIDFFFLIPIAIGLGLVGLASFMWTLKNGQYDDLQGAAERISCSRARRDPCRRKGIPALPARQTTHPGHERGSLKAGRTP